MTKEENTPINYLTGRLAEERERYARQAVYLRGAFRKDYEEAIEWSDEFVVLADKVIAFLESEREGR